MTNLTEQDLRRIETIEGYLRQLDMCNPEYSLPRFKPYQPIDTTEGELAPIETEQRWQEKIFVAVRTSDSIRNKYYVVVDSHYEDLTLKQAVELQEAIKQYLSNLK